MTADQEECAGCGGWGVNDRTGFSCEVCQPSTGKQSLLVQTPHAADQELEHVVAWLRGLHWTHKHYGAAQFFADALARHEHRASEQAVSCIEKARP